MTSKDLERGSDGDRSPGIAAAERARVVANGVTTFEARARTGRTTPTEREALLGGSQYSAGLAVLFLEQATAARATGTRYSVVTSVAAFGLWSVL